MRTIGILCALAVASPAHADEDPLTQLVSRHCIDCHGQTDPEGELRLDQLDKAFFNNPDRLETLIHVLSEEQMPPEGEEQPEAELRIAAVDYLTEKLRGHTVTGHLKRLTREEYTNTINDLFASQFDLSELLPPDRPGEGFNKWGEAQRMSPYQVESYLKTARFVADRLLLDERPEQQMWEFGVGQFSGSGRGDYRSDTAFVLSTHYPWRSNLHFYTTDKRKQLFRVPQFGRYRIEADVAVLHSQKPQTIGIATGDPRYPTNFKKIARMVVPAAGGTVSIDLTLTAGTYISFTYESAATWNVGSPKTYKGPQVAFSKVRMLGPMTETWPSPAERRIFADGRFAKLTTANTREFIEHVIRLLLCRSLPESDVDALQQIIQQKLESTDNPLAAARTLLTALLSSPHFLYKYESETLDEIAFAHRLSYFLWNSVPDAALLEAARSGKLRSSDELDRQVDRMLADPRCDRFCEDFTRQWLQTDKIDDIGPDDRVHDKKKVTFLKIRELAREPSEFFKEILRHDLSMTNFIDSDFAMANDETAEFYGYEAVESREFKRVPIPAGSERGGLVAQAGLLKLTSSKFATSPILRGTWILKNIYGQKLNPPPNLVFDEPDIRGAETVREIIEKHKSTQTCNRCHARIDPLGLALEHYDEMGRWRDKYRNVETVSLENKKNSIKIHTAPIDSKATLPGGRTINSLSDLKAVLLSDREQILKGMLSKLTSYALGREIGVRDEALIDEIYRNSGAADCSLRAAIHAIVRHQAFGRK